MIAKILFCALVLAVALANQQAQILQQQQQQIDAQLQKNIQAADGRKKSSSSSSSSKKSSSSSHHHHNNNHNLKPIHSSSSSSSSDDERWQYQSINIQPDVGFYSFYYGPGNTGNYAYQSFYFNLPYDVIVTVLDCFCAGDKYVVHDNASTNNALTCNPFNINCPINYKQPLDCLLDTANYCRSVFVANGGAYHNVSVEIALNPFLAGTGFISIQRSCSGVPCCVSPGTCEYGIFQ